MISGNREQIGKILCEKGHLTQSQLNRGLAEQDTEHLQLGQILLDLDYITIDQLKEAISVQKQPAVRE